MRIKPMEEDYVFAAVSQYGSWWNAYPNGLFSTDNLFTYVYQKVHSVTDLSNELEDGEW
jgi:hypothetical protein